MTIIDSIITDVTDIFINIDDVQKPSIYEYFKNLNDGEFQAAAELFAEQGILSPPFEKPIQGRKAIAQYLQKEALGMKLYPERGRIFTSLDRESTLITQVHYQIQGRVSTAWFTVNVSWWIKLNDAKEIMLVEVKLLAALHDLLSLNRN
jgi:Nuclear transport factor 2 (NTF2) domain